MQAKSIAFVGEPFGLTDHSPSDTKKDAATSHPEAAASFLSRNVLFAGELRAYDRVTMNVPVYTER